MRKLLMRLFGIVLVLVLIAAGYVWYVVQAAKQLDMSVMKTGEPSVIYASDGSVLGKITSKNGNTALLKDEEISSLLRLTHLAAEDKGFYTHGGFNWYGLIRASWSNAQNGSLSAGGSGITQQTVKNVYLLNQEQSIERKLKDEPPYVYRLEQEKTKKQILTLFLNSNYYGRGATGIQNGSMAWFGHPATDLRNMEDPLQVAKAAWLASLLPQPSVYDDFKGQPKNLVHIGEIRQRVLATLDNLSGISYPDDMPAAERVSPEVIARVIPAAKRLVQTLPITNTERLGETVSDADPYLLNAVKDWLIGWQTQVAKSDESVTDQDAAIRGEAAAESLLAQGGLQIYTTIVPNVQNALTKAVRPKAGANIGAVVLDPRTGSIDGMYGGSNYAANANNNALYATWQAGSTMKMVALANAVKEGISPLSRFPAPAFVRVGTDDVYNHDRSKAPGCSLTLADAIAQSNNPVAVQLATGRMADCSGTGKLGPALPDYPVSPHSIAELAREMGANDSIIPGKTTRAEIDEQPGIALGSNTLTPLKMASMGGTLANHGVHNKPWLIGKIVIREKTIFEHQGESNQVLEKDKAAIANQVLTGVYIKGTARDARVPGVQLAGKSGTAAETGASWMVSWSSVNMNDTGKPAYVIASGSDGNKFSSLEMAQLNERFFTAVLSGKNATSFPAADLGKGKRVGLK